METFGGPKPFVDNPQYERNRRAALKTLRNLIATGKIDPPIVDLITLFSRVSHCYTLQSCFGHFVHERESDEHTTARLAPYKGMISTVFYRIAYIAFVLEKSENGLVLYHDLRALALRNPGYIQFGSAGWFWEQSVNTYQIQVAPEREKDRDSFWVTYDEALQLEKMRDMLICELAAIANNHIRLAITS
jgi:hypothetical protein